MSTGEAEWKQGLRGHDLGALVDAAPRAESVSVIAHPNRTALHATPWLACVLSGRATIRKDDGRSFNVEAGQLIGEMGHLGVELPMYEDLEGEWTVELHDRETKLLVYRDLYGLRRIWSDPQCVTLIRSHFQSLLRRDPWTDFLQEKAPDLFDGLDWPSEFMIELEVKGPNEAIFRRGQRPTGIYVVVRGFVRLVFEGNGGAPDRLFAILGPGSYFGELERPAAGLYLPNLLSAISGRTEDDRKYFDEATPTWLFRIPYEVWNELVVRNREHIDLDVRLFDLFRARFATWLPIFTHAARSGLHQSLMAALVLREIYAMRLDPSGRQWNSEQRASDDTQDEAVTLKNTDLRLLLLEFCGGRPGEGKRHRQGVTQLRRLWERGWIVFVDSDPDWRSLTSLEMYKNPSRATIGVPDVSQLEQAL